MERRFRLTGSSEFTRVRKQGKSFPHPLVVLVRLPSSDEHLRVGVSASRALGNAVHRNRAKRLLREAIRPLLGRIPCHWDLVFVARGRLAFSTLAEVQIVVEGLLKRAGLLTPADEQ